LNFKLNVAEEKIDGSNLGLHFSDDWTLVTQHRGHSINPLSEAQYSKLQHWIKVHAQDLKKILGMLNLMSLPHSIQ
jgi:RNA ligase